MSLAKRDSFNYSHQNMNSHSAVWTCPTCHMLINLKRFGAAASELWPNPDRPRSAPRRINIIYIARQPYSLRRGLRTTYAMYYETAEASPVAQSWPDSYDTRGRQRLVRVIYLELYFFCYIKRGELFFVVYHFLFMICFVWWFNFLSFYEVIIKVYLIL